jgi:ABC-type uncharacterized transport system fused permease/ATPase subunit
MFPYFSPSQGNWLRIGGLVGSILINAVQAKYDKVMRSHIYTAFDFFREKRPIEEFNHIFRAALLRGLASVMAVNMAGAFLEQYVILSFRNAMISETMKRWLKEENYRGLKAIDCMTSQNTSKILAQRIPKFTSTSVGFVIERTKDLAFACFSLYRIYHLSKPLASKSVQFPFNYQRGLFAVIISLSGLFSWIKVRSQEGIAHSYAALDQQQTEILNRIAFLERNALQVATFPSEYKSNILNDIHVKANNILASASSVAMNSFFNTNLTYMFPQAFELFIVYVASLFAKADPDHFNYTESFLPLVRESANFMWRSTHFIQMTLNYLLGYYESIQEINEFSRKLSIYEKQKIALASSIKRGDRFSIESLTGKVMTDHGEKILFSQLNLKTEPGYLYFVSGKNGSGKTILLKIIAGFYYFEQGTVTVPEHVWYLQPKIAIDPAFDSFADLLSKTFGVKNLLEVEIVKDYLKKFELYYSNGKWELPEIGAGQRDWSSLSDGQKQILNLAVVLTMMQTITTPWLILADEILSHVDNIAPGPGQLSTRGVALDLLKRLATRHTILIVDHNDSGMQCNGQDELGDNHHAQFKIYKQT